MSITSLNVYTLPKTQTPQKPGGAGAYAAISNTTAPKPAAEPNAQQQPALPNTQPTPQQLEQALRNLNQFVAPVMQHIEFTMDEETDRTVIKVIDTETKKVLRQIPNEEVLAITRNLDNFKGLVVKQIA